MVQFLHNSPILLGLFLPLTSGLDAPLYASRSKVDASRLNLQAKFGVSQIEDLRHPFSLDFFNYDDRGYRNCERHSRGFRTRVLFLYAHDRDDRI